MADQDKPAAPTPLADVVMQHQRLMATFLEQQKQIMLMYLESRQGTDVERLAGALEPPMPVPSAVVTRPAPAAAPAPSTPASPPPAPQPEPAPMASRAAEPAVAAASSDLPSLDELVHRLVALVAERTGYPPEALAPTQDMEADLGIDSIKRVEILTSFAREFPNLGSAAPQQLRGARTLEDVARVMRESLAGGEAAAASEPEAQAAATAASPAVGEAAPAPADADLDRYVVAMEARALPDGLAPAVPDGALVITDDGRGCAASLRERLAALGGCPVIVRLEGGEAPAEGVYAADLGDPAQVEALLGRIRRDHGPIGGVIHLLPLRQAPPFHELSSAELASLAGQEVKGLFHLLRFASGDLKSSPGRWALGALAFGAPASDGGGLPAPEHPWRGGLVGVIKTVMVEWPEVVARCLVLETVDPEQAASAILAELAGPPTGHEAYYADGRRLVPAPRTQALARQRRFVELGPEDLIVLVGGARGITAEAAGEIARQARSTLVLVGRSPWPAAGEPEAVSRAASDAELKRVLFATLQAQGRSPSPLELDAAARRILREREMRAARSAMEAAGSRVFYYQADVRDEAATADLFRRIRETHGRPTGVVCGAGIIEDRLIEDKTPESFDRVFDTKLHAIFNLARCLDPEPLKFFVIFSSVAGWTGNRGQVDYVAANEVMNRTALHLSARWKRRVVAIDWGPWEKAGMVTNETRKQFLARGVGLVAPAAGRRFLLDEIRFGDERDAVVAALGGREPSTPATDEGYALAATTASGNG